MQAIHDEGDIGLCSTATTSVERLPASSGEMKFFIHKPGWSQPVGWAWEKQVNWDVRSSPEFVYIRVEISDFHLGHGASLFLLQGASLRQLFSDVVLKVGDRDPDIYSLTYASSPRLFVPPPRIDRLVVAHILERPTYLTPDQLFERLFMEEMKAASSF